MEEDPTSIHYYLDGSDENKAYCKKVLDEQYDIVGFPKEKRVYHINNEKELDPVYNENSKHIYKIVKRAETNEIIGYGGEKNWWKAFAPKELLNLTDEEFDKEYKVIPESNEKVLAAARIILGIKILSELELDGYCDLDAEL